MVIGGLVVVAVIVRAVTWRTLSGPEHAERHAQQKRARAAAGRLQRAQAEIERGRRF